MEMRTFPVLAGAGAHDVYPALDGTVWFTAQSAGKLGRLDPSSGKSDLIALGPGAAPHGVIVGPDGTAWVTEGGQNAIARVDPATRAVTLFPLPQELAGLTHPQTVAAPAPAPPDRGHARHSAVSPEPPPQPPVCARRDRGPRGVSALPRTRGCARNRADGVRRIPGSQKLL